MSAKRSLERAHFMSPSAQKIDGVIFPDKREPCFVALPQDCSRKGQNSIPDDSSFIRDIPKDTPDGRISYDL